MRLLSLVLLAAWGLLGCGTSLDERGCPVDKPTASSSCDSDGQVCEYEEVQGGNVDCDDVFSYAFRCEAGVWVDHGVSECHCPSDLPEADSDCLGFQDAYGCSYCGGGGPVAECGSETDYVWQVAGTCE